MPAGVFKIKPLKEFSRFLSGNWEEEIVLLEFLNILVTDVGCAGGVAFVIEGKKNFNVRAKFDPHKIFGPDMINRCQQMFVQGAVPEKPCEPVLLQDEGFFSVTLTNDNKVKGLVFFQAAEMPDGSSEMISLLATQAAVALKNSGIAREKLMIEDIISTFTSGLDLHIYYPKFAEKLLQIAPFDKLSITIPDPFRKTHLIIYAEDSKLLETTKRVPLAGSAEAWVLNTGRIIMENDFKVSRIFREDNYLFSQGLRCLLRAPLFSNGRVIGTLNIGSKSSDAYNPKQIDMFTEIGARIGAAVENALVYATVNKKLNEALVQLETTFSATLDALTVLLDRRDSGTKGHSLRVINYAIALADKLGVTGAEMENLHLGALLHDIGKVAIPDSILFKPGKLDHNEWNVMRTHPELGAEMVSRIEFLAPAMPVVLHHHEWFNGQGYPGRLAGDKIPTGAKIFAIADAFDAITSNRPYRDALQIEFALEELKRCQGTQFCPDCVDGFFSISRDQLLDIYYECQAETQFSNPNSLIKQLNM